MIFQKKNNFEDISNISTNIWLEEIGGVEIIRETVLERREIFGKVISNTDSEMKLIDNIVFVKIFYECFTDFDVTFFESIILKKEGDVFSV